MSKLKGMSIKKRIQYIWDYYKIYMGGAILMFGIAFSLIYGEITKLDYIFNTTIISSGLTEDVRIVLEEKLNDILLDDNSKNKKVQLSYIPIDNPNNSGMELLIKFISKLAAKDIDIIIANENQMENLIKDDAFLEISNVNDSNIDNGNYYVSDVNNKIYGIELKTVVF